MAEPIHPSAGAMPVRRASKPPGPRTLSPLSSVYALARDPMRFALDLWHRYGDVVRFRLLLWPAYHRSGTGHYSRPGSRFGKGIAITG